MEFNILAKSSKKQLVLGSVLLFTFLTLGILSIFFHHLLLSILFLITFLIIFIPWKLWFGKEPKYSGKVSFNDTDIIIDLDNCETKLSFKNISLVEIWCDGVQGDMQRFGFNRFYIGDGVTKCRVVDANHKLYKFNILIEDENHLIFLQKYTQVLEKQLVPFDIQTEQVKYNNIKKPISKRKQMVLKVLKFLGMFILIYSIGFIYVYFKFGDLVFYDQTSFIITLILTVIYYIFDL